MCVGVGVHIRARCVFVFRLEVAARRQSSVLAQHTDGRQGNSVCLAAACSRPWMCASVCVCTVPTC